MAAVTEGISRHRDGWLGAECGRSALCWDFTPAHMATLDGLIASYRATCGGSAKIEAEFSHPAIDADLAGRLHYRPGLVVCGFPVDKYTSEGMLRLYWGHRCEEGIEVPADSARVAASSES